VLQKAFPRAEVDLDRYPETGKVGASVIWEGFVGKEQMDRQAQVRKSIRKSFSTDEAQRFTLIITLTPDEMAAMREV
jgi:acid stress-induced BolA-like protein IbaG/YrbA